MVKDLIWHIVDEICTIDYSLDSAVATMLSSSASSLSPFRHDNADVFRFSFVYRRITFNIYIQSARPMEKTAKAMNRLITLLSITLRRPKM